MANFILIRKPAVETAFAVFLGDAKYNFRPANSAAQNTAALTQAIADAQAGPRRVLLPAGDYNLNPVTVPLGNPIILEGAGAEDTYQQTFGTRLNYSAATGDLLTIGAAGCFLYKLALRNTNVNVTGGSGVKIDIRGPHPTANQLFPNGVGSNFRIFACSFNGFFVNVDIRNAFEWNITDSLSVNSKLAGIRVASEQLPDGGDGHITGCQILAGKYDAGYGVLQNSSGGLAIAQTKFNAGRHPTNGKFLDGFYYQPNFDNTPPGVLAETSIILIGAGTSFENYKRHAIHCEEARLLSFVGPLEIAPYGSADPAILCVDCEKIVVVGCVFVKAGSTYTKAGRFIGCDKIEIGGNETWDFGPEVADAWEFINCGEQIRLLGGAVASVPTDPPTSTPPGQQLQFAALDYQRPAVNTIFTPTSTGLRVQDATNNLNSDEWTAYAYGTTSLGLGSQPGLQGRLLLTGQVVQGGLDFVIALNNYKATSTQQTQFGLYGGNSSTFSIKSGTLAGGGATTGTPTNYTNNQTAGYEIWIYDNKVEFFYSPDSNPANTVLIESIPAAPTFPLIPTVFLRQGSQIRGLQIAGYNLVATPA